MRDLFAELYTHFATEPDRRGWIHVKCPICGAEPNEKKPNFSFNSRGFFCYSCQNKGNLKNLSQKTGLWSDSVGHRGPTAPAQPVRRPPASSVKPEPEWKHNAEQLVEGYCRHPDRERLWSAYKPVNRATINRHALGVGKLPGQRTTRLIVPLFWDGKIVGLKGRDLPGVKSDVPWIAATGSNVTNLWGINYVPQRTQQVWICENYIDAALVTQMIGFPAVAAGGARTLTDAEIDALVRLNPQHIVMAYDNDLVGQAGPLLRAQLEQEWREEKKRESPPKSAAFENVSRLRKSGLDVSLFPWPEDAPPKADLMWALMQED